MTPQQIAAKVAEKANRALSPRRILRRVAFRLDALSVSRADEPYRERPESGPSNLAFKLQRVSAGGRFEPADVEIINIAAETLLGEDINILEVGAGTGMFASAAVRNPKRRICASELDRPTLEWAAANRAHPNVTFCARHLSDVAIDEFDVVVSLEVVEHVADFAGFLDELSFVAPRAIISTPNKNRTAFDSIIETPAYDGHVREWTAGEFYWVLRVFYDDVKLYTIRNFERQVKDLIAGKPANPTLSICGPLSRELPLIADCRRPRRRTARLRPAKNQN